MLFKSALHIFERFSFKKSEAWKLWKTVGEVTQTTAAQLTAVVN
jgi:hypothetical protein